MVECPSSLLRYPIIAMAVDYDIKNENYNKNRRTGSDRPYKCHICYPILVYTCCSSVLPAVIYLIYLDNWGRWKKGGKHLTVVRLQGQTWIWGFGERWANTWNKLKSGFPCIRVLLLCWVKFRYRRKRSSLERVGWVRKLTLNADDHHEFTRPRSFKKWINSR